MNINNLYVLKKILNSIEQIKGTNIKILNLRKIENIIFDYIVICSAKSYIQICSIVRLIKENILKNPINIEGFIKPQWVIMDYETILVNIFQKSIRKYYNIETLWLEKLLTKKIII